MSVVRVPYRVPVVSLVTAGNDVALVQRGDPFGEIRVSALAVVTFVKIRVGEGDQYFTMRQGNRLRCKGAAASAGVYVQVPAGGAGAQAEFTVVGVVNEYGQPESGPAFEVIET